MWLASILSIVATYAASYVLINETLEDGTVTLWWKLVDDHHLRHAGRGDHPRDDQGVHVRSTAATCSEVVTASREGGASLNMLSGLDGGQLLRVLGRWRRHHVGLMAIAYGISQIGAARRAARSWPRRSDLRVRPRWRSASWAWAR